MRQIFGFGLALLGFLSTVIWLIVTFNLYIAIWPVLSGIAMITGVSIAVSGEE